MRVLIICRPEPGHVHPIANVAAWLIDGGHHVTWVAFPWREVGVADPPADADGKTCLDGLAGVEVVACPPIELPGWYRRPRKPESLAEHLRALHAESMMLFETMPAPVDALRQVIRAQRPDVVAIDPSCTAATFAAEREGVRYAHVYVNLEPLAPHALVEQCAFADDREGMDENWAAYHRWLDVYGLARRARGIWYVGSPWLNTVFTTEAFAGEQRRRPAHTHLVGPSVPRGARGDETLARAFPWPRIDRAKPLVYVSFGSQLPVDERVLATIAEAAAPLGVQVVFSIPNLPASAREDLAGDVVVVRYAPQRELLEQAAVCVTHGGANSVMEALWAGVPLLVAPMFADNPITAHFVVESGVGRSIELAASSERWREALAALLGAGYRDRARAVQADYRQRDGAREVARLLVERP